MYFFPPFLNINEQLFCPIKKSQNTFLLLLLLKIPNLQTLDKLGVIKFNVINNYLLNKNSLTTQRLWLLFHDFFILKMNTVALLWKQESIKKLISYDYGFIWY